MIMAWITSQELCQKEKQLHQYLWATPIGMAIADVTSSCNVGKCSKGRGHYCILINACKKFETFKGKDFNKTLAYSINNESKQEPGYKQLSPKQYQRMFYLMVF